MKLFDRSCRLFAKLLVVLWLPVGCVPPNQPGGEGGVAPSQVYTQPIIDLIDAAEDLSIELTEKGLPDKVVSWVDDLIVTAQPGSGMPEIGRMKEGEQAEYLHQRTLLKKEATLRGQRFKERYLLVKLASGQMGWVHEGGIRYVYPRYQKVVDQVVATATAANQRTRGGSSAPAIAPEDQRIIVPGKRVGPITKSTSQEKLLEIYGGTQVGLSTITTPEGDLPCTVIFPGEPSELRITWDDEARTKIKAVYIDKRESTWFTEDGLGVGLPMSDIIKANRAPVAFYGFGWAYGGVVESWKKGSLSRFSKGFYAVFAPDPQVKEIPSSFQGERILSSNEAGVDRLGLYLSRLVVYLD